MEEVGKHPNLIEPSHKRALMAEAASVDLGVEIGSLDELDINETTAPFLAGLMIGREIERNYLESYSAYYNDVGSGLTEGSMVSKREAGKLLEAYRNARSGDLTALKGFIEHEADIYRSMSEDFHEETGPEPKHENYRKASENMKIIANRLNDQTSFTDIKIPSPAWMEELAPLKSLLEKFKIGGDT